MCVMLTLTAAVVIWLPVAMLALTVAYMEYVMFQAWELWLSVLDFWHLGWKHLGLFLWIAVQVGFGILLLRQLTAPRERDHAWLPVLPLDQSGFHKLMVWVAGSMRMRLPSIIAVDATSDVEARMDNIFLSLMGRGLRVKVGLSLAVQLTARQLAGLLAHELAFYKGMHGALPGRIIRNVENWFRRRTKIDPWNGHIWDSSTWIGRIKRTVMQLVWVASFISSLPMRFLSWLAKTISAPGITMQVEFADRCGAAVAGSEAYAEAILLHGRLTLAWTAVEENLLNDKSAEELPDNLPLLLARQWLTSEVPEIGPRHVSHRVRRAAPDLERSIMVRKWRMRGAWQDESEVEATAVFSNFHELARRATSFYYQNDLDHALPQLRLVTVEETIYGRRRSAGALEEPKRYFKGLAHPDRSCCGIAENLLAGSDTEVLRIELIDCRFYINQHCHHMASLLEDWAKTWRMVRDLESAHTLKKAGLHVHKHQLAAFTVEDLQEEIERQRAIMDSMETQLRTFEGRLESRMACCLELLSREEPAKLPAKLREVRRTLPHWVMIYEHLGLNLPIFRELLTSFGAFQSLGATVVGRIESASYITTVQQLVPKIIMQVGGIVDSLSTCPYPFDTARGPERLTLDRYLSAHLDELFSLFTIAAPGILTLPEMDDKRKVIHEKARRLVAILAPFLDNYIQLYHQSFAWVTRAMQMAEWHFADPMEGAVIQLGPDEARESRTEREDYDPSWLNKTIPVPDPELKGRRTTLLIAR
jgi:hypothetical protein